MTDSYGATALSQMESQVKSAEATVAFIQDQHAQVLSGLHKEIEDLQRKCSGMDFFTTGSTS